MSDPPQIQRQRVYQTCASVDMAALGRSARQIGEANPVLSAMLFKLLGLNCVLTSDVEKAFATRKLDIARGTKSLDLYMHILWLAREGLAMVEDFVMPMVHGIQGHRSNREEAQEGMDTDMAVLKIMCYKLRADYLNLYCLFHNSPAVARVTTPPGLRSARNRSIDKGKQRATEDTTGDSPTIDRSNTFTPGQLSASSLQPSHPLEYGMQSPYAGAVQDFSLPIPDVMSQATFLLPLRNYIPDTLFAYLEVVDLVDNLLWGSHPIRLSTKLSYAQFLFDCCAAGTVVDGKVDWRSSAESGVEDIPRGHDGKTEARHICFRAIKHAYNTTQGVNDEMFADSARLVLILSRMAKIGNERPRSASGSTQGNRGGGDGNRGSVKIAARRHGRSQSASLSGSTSSSPSLGSEDRENDASNNRRRYNAPYGGDAAQNYAVANKAPEKPGRGARLGQMIYGARDEGSKNGAGITELPTSMGAASRIASKSSRAGLKVSDAEAKKPQSPKRGSVRPPVTLVPGIAPRMIGGEWFGDPSLAPAVSSGSLYSNMI